MAWTEQEGTAEELGGLTATCGRPTRQIYRTELNALKSTMQAVPNTPFTIHAKVLSLVVMNMRYEQVAFNVNLQEHPYPLTAKIIAGARVFFEMLLDVDFVESADKSIAKGKSLELIEKHEELWQEIWSRHDEKEFQALVDRKSERLVRNYLLPLIQNKECVDFGCGNGSFAFAVLAQGARSVVGIDCGFKSIRHARHMARARAMSAQATFLVDDVCQTSLPTGRFDFAISNGVFHHLKADAVACALREVARVLKPGGWFWYYVDGKDAISMDLWDASVEMLQDVDVLAIERVLLGMNVGRNKIVHIMDGLSATYLHSTIQEVIDLLAGAGFDSFRRLVGGTATDFDHDRIAADPYGKEKFGDGDLRILCRRH